MAVSPLEVSVPTGKSGLVLVLAGEGVHHLRRAAGRGAHCPGIQHAVRLTIDATELRYADSASIRTLVMAAMKIAAGDGTVTAP